MTIGARRQTLAVEAPSKQYQITIDRNWIDRAFLKALAAERKIVMITDENVYQIYRSLLEGFDVFVIEAGEASKCMSSYSDIQRYMIERHLTRSDAVIAFGGGVVGDLAGFVAATYMRGIGFIQIPTTLLAMVDSSVGGKVAINHGVGKNILGTFYQPDAVYMDTAFLDTLPNAEFACGMAEIIKYGLIKDAALFEMLADLPVAAVHEQIAEIIHRCCAIKAEVVAADEGDRGIRQILNFGHTVGHAVESFYHYKTYTHGQGVAIGMALKAKLALANGAVSNADYQRIIATLEKFDLPIAIHLPAEMPDVLKEVIHDKKAEGSVFKLIELETIGMVRIAEYSYASLLDILS
jgi:3-dehydroquinate synthase